MRFLIFSAVNRLLNDSALFLSLGHGLSLNVVMTLSVFEVGLLKRLMILHRQFVFELRLLLTLMFIDNILVMLLLIVLISGLPGSSYGSVSLLIASLADSDGKFRRVVGILLWGMYRLAAWFTTPLKVFTLLARLVQVASCSFSTPQFNWSICFATLCVFCYVEEVADGGFSYPLGQQDVGGIYALMTVMTVKPVCRAMAAL